MASYPKWLYHPSKPAVVVDGEAAHRALGAGWVESPADFRTEAAPQPAPHVEPAPEPKKPHKSKGK